jgi:mono/diheme cytochrome c family protein
MAPKLVTNRDKSLASSLRQRPERRRVERIKDFSIILSMTKTMRIATLPATWLSLFFSVVWIELFPLEAASSSIDFSRDVQPILSDNCYACHGPDSAKRKAGLRLDDPESAKKVLKSGTRAIVPGDPARSSLIERVTSKDADELMPPEESGKTLTPAQVDVLRRWIKEGAPWKKHWAFVPPESPAVPRVQLKRWPRNPIDHFILARDPRPDRFAPERRGSERVPGRPSPGCLRTTRRTPAELAALWRTMGPALAR